MKREENQTVEYKESWHEKYLEWICGYANAKGGTLYVGIEDGTKRPVGIKNPNKLMEDIPNTIRNTMGIVADVALLKKSGKDVIRVKVKPSAFPVSYHGGFHYRTGSVKMQLTGPALTQFLMEKSGMQWDAAATFGGFRRSEHAFTALMARYYKERKVKFADSDFESFGLEFPDGRLTNTGALMSDDCPLTHSRVFCTRWNGLTMASGVMDTKDTQEYAGGILSLLSYSEDFVRINSKHRWKKLPRTRAEFVEYPERAVHEALVNALIHRDYLITGSEVHVDMFDDRLEITSPGGMPDGRQLSGCDIHNIPSVRRNKLLADICERLRVMERRGSGFKKILEDYERIAFNPAKRMPVIEAETTYFRIVFPNLLYGFTEEQIVEMSAGMPPVVPPVVTPVATPVVTPVVTPVELPSEGLFDDIQRKVLSALVKGEMSTAILAKTVGVTQAKNLRRRYLRLLLDARYIEYTIPAKPNSRLQQYRLTDKGRMFAERIRSAKKKGKSR